MPPKPNPQRRNARVGPTRLPAEGRKGAPPAWPLPGDPTAWEWAAWTALWATPQAVAWERLGWVRTVGRFCRVMVAAELPDANTALLAQTSALEDRLGLTPKAMRLLLWEIAAEETVEPRKAKKVTPRKRLRAVD